MWRLVEVWNRLDLASLGRSGDDEQVQASTDTPVQISLVYCSDLTAAVRCAADIQSQLCTATKRCDCCPGECLKSLQQFIVHAQACVSSARHDCLQESACLWASNPHEAAAMENPCLTEFAGLDLCTAF